MADQLAAEFAARQIASELATLQLEAESLAEAATIYAASFKAGSPTPGGANRLVQAAAWLAQHAARYDGIRETVAYLAPLDSTKES